MLYVLLAVIKYCGQINVRRIDFGSLFKVESVMVGKLRQQEVDAVGHIASPLSEQGVRNVCVQRFTLFTIQNPDPENSAAHFQYEFSYLNKSN